MILRSNLLYLTFYFIINLIIPLTYGKDVPIPRFQITSKEEQITIYDSITISLEHSYIPNDGETYTFCVIFDENKITEDDLENVWRGKKEDILNDDVRFSTIYDEPGDKTIVILVTSTRFYFNKDKNIIESDGLISSSTKKIQIKVEYGTYCYHYSQHIDWDPYSKNDLYKKYFNGNSPIMHIQLYNAHYPSNTQMAIDATRSFSLIGEHPTLYLYNNTHSYVIESENILNDKTEWRVRIDKSYLYSVNPIHLKIKSKGSTILGCGIEDIEMIFHIPTVYELDLGLDITDKF
ncbi:hypothetical protein PIROE2DRAFT_6444, partial [Piromyces sp. E2]